MIVLFLSLSTAPNIPPRKPVAPNIPDLRKPVDVQDELPDDDDELLAQVSQLEKSHGNMTFIETLNNYLDKIVDFTVFLIATFHFVCF